jgi:glycosyltransferase involved in cell wall biosynthesis
VTQLIESNSKASSSFLPVANPFTNLEQKELLLVLPVPFRVQENKLLFESQACNGLERWADNFGSVIVVAPIMPESLAQEEKTIVWQDTQSIAHPERFEFVPLPWAYSTRDFLLCYGAVRVTLGRLIKRSRYLQFAIGGLFGDWAAIAALEAHQQGRAYAIHTDRVEHQVMRSTARDVQLKTKLKATVFATLMEGYHKHIIKNCTLGLWHGNDCYAAYSPFCSNSHLIHDVHTKASDIISPQSLLVKAQRVKTDKTLRICYAGRLEAMKAPFDWVLAIETALKLGVKIQATWLGDGSLFEQTRAMIAQRGLGDEIQLIGFESNRQTVLQKIRESHLMLFTHITPESPRCLIESLTCGTPIIGYHSQYASDLVKDFGGGVFAPTHDWKQLGELLVDLSRDRQQLSQLIVQAGKNGTRFHDQAVFQERSNLIKKHLTVTTSKTTNEAAPSNTFYFLGNK